MVQHERRQRRSSTHADAWEAEDDQYLVAADNFYNAKETMIKSSNPKSDGLQDVYEFEPPVIENMPTAIGYHSEDSADVMWEEKSRASRYTTNLGSIDEEDSYDDFDKDDRGEVEDTSTQDGFRDDDESSHMDDRYAGYHRIQDENKNTQNAVVQTVWSDSTQSNGKPMWRSNSTNSFAAGEVKSSSTSFTGPARGSVSQKSSHSNARSQSSLRPNANAATVNPPREVLARPSGSYSNAQVKKTPSSASKASSKKLNGMTGSQHSNKSKKLAASRSSLSSSSSKKKKPELHKKHQHVKQKDTSKGSDSGRQVNDPPRANGLLALIRRKQSPENYGSMKSSSTKSKRSRSSSKRTSSSKSSKSAALNRKKTSAPLQNSNSKSSKKDETIDSALTKTPKKASSSSSQPSRQSSSSRSNSIHLNRNSSHTHSKSAASGSVNHREDIPQPTKQSSSSREIRPPEQQQPTSAKRVGSDARVPYVTTRNSSRHSTSSATTKEEPIETTPQSDWDEGEPKTTKQYGSGDSSSISSRHLDDAESSGSLSLKPSKESSQKAPPPQHDDDDDDWPGEDNAPSKLETQTAPIPATALSSNLPHDDPLLQIRANFSGSAVGHNEAHESKIRNIAAEADPNAHISKNQVVPATNPPKSDSEEKHTKESLFSILYRQHCSTFAACASTIDGIANVGVTERWSFLDWGVDCNKAEEEATDGKGGAKDGMGLIEGDLASPREDSENDPKDYDHFEGFEHVAPKGIYSPSMSSQKPNASKMLDFTNPNRRRHQAKNATDNEAGNAETDNTPTSEMVSPVHFVQSGKDSKGQTSVTSKTADDKNGGQQGTSTKAQLKNDKTPLSPADKPQDASMKAGDNVAQSNGGMHAEDLGEEAEVGIEHPMELHLKAQEGPRVTQEQRQGDDQLHQIPKTINVDYPESIPHTISISSIEIPTPVRVPTYQQEEDGSISILGLEKKPRKGSTGKNDNRQGNNIGVGKGPGKKRGSLPS